MVPTVIIRHGALTFGAKRMAKKMRPGRRGKPQARRERRFEPRPTTQPVVAYALGGLGAILMGAGAWRQFGAVLATAASAVEAQRVGPYLLAVGAVLTAAAIWLGTSGEPAIRVGDGGIAVEKGELRRMPWYAVNRIEWRAEAVRVTGRDDADAAMTIVVKADSYPQAAAWIVKEARARVPAVVDVPADATLPDANAASGVPYPLDPPQVVGKHCAATGKVISYEPDARVCPRCGRVYHKDHVAEACACGASLAELRG